MKPNRAASRKANAEYRINIGLPKWLEDRIKEEAASKSVGPVVVVRMVLSQHYGVPADLVSES